MNMRQWLPSDAEAIYAIECQSFSVPWSKNAIEKEVTNPLAHYIVAEVDGEIVGYAGMWKVMGEGQITNIAVGERYRGNKIGTTLAYRLIEDAKENELNILILEVRKSNEAAKKLYQKVGFLEVGSRKNYYSQPTEDGIIMTLDVDVK